MIVRLIDVLIYFYKKMFEIFEKMKLKWDMYILEKLIKKLEKPISINLTPLRYKYSKTHLSI